MLRATPRGAAERRLTVATTCRQPGRPLSDLLMAAGEAALHGTAAPSLLPPGEGELNTNRATLHPSPRPF
jgi:hypothetical protein